MVDAGAELVPFTLDTIELMLAARMLTSSDAYLYHAPLLQERGELYGDQHLRYRLLASQYLRAEDYSRALRVRRLVIHEFVSLFERMDVFVAPTCPVAAFPIDATTVTFGGTTYDLSKPMGGSFLARNTSPTNFTGHPSISLPAGRTAAGLPIGLMLTAAHFEDMKLLAVAQAVEQLIGYDDVAPWFTARVPVAGDS